MITAVSLFSGIGGIDIAFKQVGFDVIWANEIDKYACVTYRNNFTNHLLEADIKDTSVANVPKSDVLFGGFPCQSYPEKNNIPKNRKEAHSNGKRFREIRDKICELLQTGEDSEHFVIIFPDSIGN